MAECVAAEVNIDASHLGRYTLIRRLATGGMGVVYLGRVDGAANFSKLVAIKRILPHLAGNREFVSKFIDEANLMVQLHHGNIVPVLELADEAGELYLVMEYLPGRDLKAVIRRLRERHETMEADLALWLTRELCAGLDYAHHKINADGQSLNLVHRDVSPSNVVLGAGGEVKLIDFGIARARGRLYQSVSGALQGKFVYMSPEQAIGSSVTALSDIFSTGLLLYEMATGRRPFEAETEAATIEKVKSADIRPPSHFNSDLPPEFDALVLKALERNPELRYQTSSEFARAISHYLAARESTVQARSLSSLLTEIFPEGVVPSAETSPRSMDDALRLQLDAVGSAGTGATQTTTRSGNHIARVDTGSLPHLGSHNGPYPMQSGTPANYGLSYPGGTPGPSGSMPYPTGEFPYEPKVTGRKRALFFGLLTGALLAAGLLFWQQKPREAQLAITTSPIELEKVSFTVDDVLFGAGDVLTAGGHHKVCAKADGHLLSCQRIKLKAGQNRIGLTLSERPYLAPSVSPAGTPHVLLVDQAPISDERQFFDLDSTHVVCVQAESHVAQPPCKRVKFVSGPNPINFSLSPKKAQTNDPSVPVGKADAKAQSPNGTPETPKEIRPRRKSPARGSRQVRLDSIPTAEIWHKGASIGTTPMDVSITDTNKRYILKAKGYANTPYVVGSKHRSGPVLVSLLRPGYLTLRVMPPASEIWLDDKQVGSGILNRYATAPGRHELVVRYYRDGRKVGSVGPKRVLVEAGKETRLAPINVPVGSQDN